jgi:hypothetical protein
MQMARLASALDFPEYRRIARSLWADQAFWRFLLPKRGCRGKLAVVFETRFGSISLAISDLFDTVVVAHTNIEILELTKIRIGPRAGPRYHFVQIDPALRLPFSTGQVSGVILFDLEGDALTSNIDLDAARYHTLIDEAARVAAADGSVLIGANNGDSYYFWKNRLRRWLGLNVDPEVPIPRLSLTLKLLKMESFKEGAVFISQGLFNPVLDVLPELSNWASPHRDEAAQEGQMVRFRNQVLKAKPLLDRWPSFLVVGARRKALSFIEELLRSQPAVQNTMGWSSGSHTLILRLIAGNGNTTIAVAGPRNGRGTSVVIRLPYDGESLARCKTNALALTTLRSSCLDEVIPFLVSQGTFDGQPYFIESLMPGAPVASERKDRTVDEMIISACERFSEFQVSQLPTVAIARTHWLVKLDPWISALPGVGIPAQAGHVASVRDLFERALDDTVIPSVPSHGDWKTGNLLFDRGSQLRGVIDWEYFERDGLPGLDFLLLVMYKLAKEASGNIRDIFVRNLLPWKVPKVYRDLFSKYLRLLNIDDHGFAVLRAVFWIGFLYFKADRIDKEHPVWKKSSWLDVWPHIQELLFSHSR